MRHMLLAAVGLVALAAQPALAADLKARRAAPPPPPVPVATGWSGFYIGGHFGGSRGDVHGIFDSGTTFRNDTSGGLAGGQLGFNWQAGSWVFGLEGDWSWAKLTGTARCPNPAFQCHSELDWLATARARLGYAVGPILFYATGGGAWADQTISTVGPAGNPFQGSTTLGVGGWTAGVGLEWQPFPTFPNLSIKAEWLHYDLGGSNNFDTCSGNVAVGCIVVNPRHTGELVRGGVNYRFTWGGGPIAAAF